MFYMSNLNSFNGNLESLTNGSMMFYETNLSSFKTNNLKNLQDGSFMFYYCNIASFNYDMPNLINGEGMFNGAPGFHSLTTFNGDLSSLTDGDGMFSGSSLENFVSNLSSLQAAQNMFAGCNLTPESIEIIKETINDLSEYTLPDNPWATFGKITITFDDATYPDDKELVRGYCQEIANKNWIVYLNYTSNSSNNETINPLSLDDEELVPKLYIKAVEVSEEEANYIDKDEKYYILLCGEEIFGDDIENYQLCINKDQFIYEHSLTPYTKPEE